MIARPQSRPQLFRVLGCDPGTAYCGLVVLTHDWRRSSVAIAETLSGEDVDQALALIQDWVMGLPELVHLVAIERQDNVAAALQAAGRSSRAAMNVLQVVGMLKGEARRLGVPCWEIDLGVARRAVTSAQRPSEPQARRAMEALLPGCLRTDHEAAAGAVALAATRAAAVDYATAGKLSADCPYHRRSHAARRPRRGRSAHR